MILIVDSWAWLALGEDNDLADKCLRYLNSKENKLSTTLLNIYEVYYKIKSRSGEEVARQYIESIKQHAAIIGIDEQLVFLAGDVRLKEQLSVVDSFVYATAIQLNGAVLTGDPHFKGKDRVIFIG